MVNVAFTSKSSMLMRMETEGDGWPAAVACSPELKSHMNNFHIKIIPACFSFRIFPMHLCEIWGPLSADRTLMAGTARIT
jgi:hypothetical protein